MAIKDQTYSGTLRQGGGAGVESADVALRRTAADLAGAAQVPGVSTNAAGTWSFTVEGSTYSLAYTYDVEIAAGAEKRFLPYSDEIVLKGVDTSYLKVRHATVPRIHFIADNGDDAGDIWRIGATDHGTGTIAIGSDKASADTIIDYFTIKNGASAAASVTTILGTLELGHASDTTIARSGSGAITVEGVQVLLAGAQTGVTTILNASTKIGRDADNLVDFATTDNNIIFRANGENQLTLSDGALTPSSNAIVDLGTDALEFKDAYFDGTLEADAITIGGTNVVTGSLITTLGTISAGVWNGTAITGAYINDDIISGQTEITSGLAAADELLYSDGGTVKKVGLDNFVELSPALATEDAIANGDYILFLDGGASGNMNKEAVHDLATLFAGSGLTATNSVIAVDAASESAAGRIEIATAAEITTSTSDTLAMTPGRYSDSIYGTRYIQVQVFEGATDITEGPGKAHVAIPPGLNGMDLVDVQLEVVTAGNGSTVDVGLDRIRKSGSGWASAVDMMTTNCTIESQHVSSSTNTGTEFAINSSNADVATSDIIQINVDGDGGNTTIAEGLIVTMGFRIPAA